MEIIKRLFFVLLVTAVLVFFSEKMYWYPSGFVVGELLFFYGVPVFVCLWVVDAFRVQTAVQMILVASLFAFLTEGVLTPVIFEAGLLDPIMPAYFVGWHGLLSFMFGFYLVRKWLLAGNWPRLLAGSVGVGLLWGIWSPTYWLPENFDGFAIPGQWSVADFGLYAFVYTAMFVVAHAILGRGAWLGQFKPNRIEKWAVIGLMLFFFAALSFPAAPFGVLKLGVLCTAVFLPLHLHKKQADPHSIFQTMAGQIQVRYLPMLFVMPGVATAVYATFAAIQPPVETLRLILELTPLLQAAIGGAAFLWAIWSTVASAKSVAKSALQI